MERKAPCCIRSWEVMTFMTASHERQGGERQMASWQLLTIPLLTPFPSPPSCVLTRSQGILPRPDQLGLACVDAFKFTAERFPYTYLSEPRFNCGVRVMTV